MVQAAQAPSTTAVSWLARKADVTDRALHLGIASALAVMAAPPFVSG